MFVDASTICAIILAEEDGEDLYLRLRRSETSATSALAIWESVVAVARSLNLGPKDAEGLVMQVLDETGTKIVPVPPEAARLAIEAFERFGKGRHPAALNFGDCFSYACARHLDMPLLFKGDDFDRTDIPSALAVD